MTWNPGSSVPEYEPVPGALVSGVDVTGEPLWATVRPGQAAGPNVAVSQRDGTYALLDLHYQGGPVTISATIDGVTRTATAYEANPQDLKSPGLQFVRHVAVANVTFPAAAPPEPAPAIPVKMFVEDDEGHRSPVTGVVVAGTPVIVGTTATDVTILAAETVGGDEEDKPCDEAQDSDQYRTDSKTFFAHVSSLISSVHAGTPRNRIDENAKPQRRQGI